MKKKFFNKLFLPGAIILATAVFIPCPSSVHGDDTGDSESPAQVASTASESNPAGKVIETMNSGGYTYVLLEKEGKQTWAAVRKIEVSVGDDIELKPGIDMVNFTSKTLSRTFPYIIFSAGPISDQQLTDDDIVSMAHGGRSLEEMATGNRKQSADAEKINDELIKKAHGGRSMASLAGSGKEAPSLSELNAPVEKAQGANSYLVAEIHAKKDELAGKEIVVRGRAVKIATGILGTNWIHLRDGSGDPQTGTDDITVTSNDLPETGDIITMKGTLHTNKDFGAGYKYDVIVMEGLLQVSGESGEQDIR